MRNFKSAFAQKYRSMLFHGRTTRKKMHQLKWSCNKTTSQSLPAWSFILPELAEILVPTSAHRSEDFGLGKGNRGASAYDENMCIC